MSDAELEATYRFLSNDDVDWRSILRPHIDATRTRCAKRPVIVAHDTTEFHFRGADGAREGLGLLSNSHRGFEAHVALALGLERMPLGIVGLIPVVTKEHKKKVSASEASRRSTLTPQEEKKTARWDKLVRDAEAVLGAGRALHVMDREADAFVHWATWKTDGVRFVIRANSDRMVDPRANTRMSTLLEAAPLKLEREVPLSMRSGSKRRADAGKKERTPRTGRLALLCVRAESMKFPRPVGSQAAAAECALNVVHVFEPNPPAGEEAVEWRLLTSEPIDSPAAIEAVIDAYRARWIIEELFKAVKTGCAFEKRQLMSLRALLNALAITLPIAWRLLALRARAQTNSDAPASEFFSRDELRLLRRISQRVKLSANPTAQEALLAIAGLGGHLKRNGRPGWQTLGAGFERFIDTYAGWLTAREM